MERILACPDGGKHGLAGDGLAATCSFHGSTHWMRPCCENDLRGITIEERDEYQVFVDRYSRYWETYFDPIGIRIGLTDASYRLETVILPLIQNSYYDGLLRLVSSDSLQSEPPVLPDGTLLGISLKVNKLTLTDLMLYGSTLDSSDDGEVMEDAPPIEIPTQAELGAEIDRKVARSLQDIGIESVGNKEIAFGEFLLEGLGDEIGVFRMRFQAELSLRHVTADWHDHERRGTGIRGDRARCFFIFRPGRCNDFS